MGIDRFAKNKHQKTGKNPKKSENIFGIINDCTKGVPGLECWTGGLLVSSAKGREFFFWNPIYFGLKMLI